MEKMLGVGKVGSRMIYFNPFVSVTCAVCIWVFVIYAMVEQDEAAKDLVEWQDWVTDIWNWFYMSSQNVLDCHPIVRLLQVLEPQARQRQRTAGV
jgi:hypothetical protein